MLEYDLFSLLESMDVDLQGTSFQGFLDDANNANLSSIFEASTSLDQSTEYKQLSNELENLTESLSFLNQLFMNGQIEENAYKQDVSNLLAEIKQTSELLSAQTSIYELSKSDELQYQNTVVESISSVDVYESNMKWALAKELEFKDSNFTDFSQSVWDAIYALAIQCPKDGGHAVFVARSLYYSKKWIDFTAFQSCGALQERENELAKMDVYKEADIFPNPSNGSFLLTWTNQESADLEIFDLNGVLIHTQIVQFGDNNITLDKKTSGIYFYVIKNELGVQNQGKLTILD